jgi:carbonic anhydrase
MHQAKALIIGCMDFRTQLGLIELTKKKGCLGGYDLVSNMGSSGFFLKNEALKESLIDTIRTAHKKHDIKTVIIIHHDNCNAYGISDPTEEKAVQTKDMRTVETIINRTFPDIKVIKLWGSLDEEKKKIVSYQEVK